MTNTIYALATFPGRAGVAVIRLSGPRADAGLQSLTPGRALPGTRRTGVRKLTDPVSGALLDEAMVIRFQAPASYTGEDVVELHLHGGMAVVDAVLAALSRLDGFRLAEPGEFTRRAFENGKMDLTAAEAVADLIDAQTQAQKHQALQQMGGALARLYEGWTERLKRALAHLEADIDFPDEDLPDGVAAQVRPVIEALQAELRAHLDDNRRGERLRGGIQVAVIGAPNAGKSSLVNALTQRDVAIVSPHAGTTRDVLEVHLDLGGYPVILADTAGLRPDQIGQEGQEGIESEGIRRALRRAEEADIRLLVFDGTALPQRDPHTEALINETSLIVFNKADQFASIQGGDLFVSALTGAGLDTLIAALLDRIRLLLRDRAAPSPTRQRHREALTRAETALARALIAPAPELVAEDLRLAIRHLGQITGRVDVEDLLDVIFRDFCIGK